MARTGRWRGNVIIIRPQTIPPVLIEITRPKVRVSGAFSTKPVKVRAAGGAFVEKQMKIKQAGSWVNV